MLYLRGFQAKSEWVPGEFKMVPVLPRFDIGPGLDLKSIIGLIA